MELTTIVIINSILGGLLAVSGTYLLIYAYNAYFFEKASKRFKIFDTLNNGFALNKKIFYVAFYTLEISLVSFFVFWGLLFLKLI